MAPRAHSASEHEICSKIGVSFTNARAPFFFSSTRMTRAICPYSSESGTRGCVQDRTRRRCEKAKRTIKSISTHVERESLSPIVFGNAHISVPGCMCRARAGQETGRGGRREARGRAAARGQEEEAHRAGTRGRARRACERAASVSTGTKLYMRGSKTRESPKTRARKMGDIFVARSSRPKGIALTPLPLKQASARRRRSRWR